MEHSLPRRSVALIAGIILALGTLAWALSYAAYPASDVIGQLDLSNQGIFTKGGINNGPNNRGFSQPLGATIDTVHHRLFTADFANNRVLVFNLDSSNALIDRIADNVLGQPTFFANATATSQTGMRGPQGLAYDSLNDRLFVADSTNNRVLVFDVSSITDGEGAINVLGQPNFTSNATNITQSGMNGASRVTYDAQSQRLFVGDISNNRVLVFNASAITDGMNASYVLGQPDFTSNTASTSQSGMNLPTSGAFDPENQRLFVPEFGNNRVTVWDVATSTIANGGSATHVLGQSSFTSSTASTSQAGVSGVADATYDSISQRLFVSGFNNNRITIFDVATSTIANGMNASYVLGQSTFSSGGALTIRSAARTPAGQAYDSANNRLYVAERDNNRVTVFDVATSTIANGANAVDLLGQLDSNDQPVYIKNGAHNGPNNLGFNRPLDIALDAVHHRLFVSEDSNRRVLVFNLDSANNLLDKIPDYVLGQADFSSNTSTVSASTIVTAAGVAYDSLHNRLFVADRGAHRILVWDVSTISNGMSATNVLGQSSFTASSAGTSQSTLNLPQGDVEYDPYNERLFVVDRSNNRVLVFNATSTILDGQAASYVLGQATFGSSTASSSQSGMSGPIGLAYDTSTQRLFVSEGTNNRITVWDVATSTIANGGSALYVLGQSTYGVSTAGTTEAKLSAPQELGYDSLNKRLFVSDFSNRRFVAYDVATSTIANGANALAVLGQNSFTVSSSATTQDGVGGGPVSTLYDEGNNRLYALDYGNSRVLIYTFAELGTYSFPDGVIGESFSGTPSVTNSQGTVRFALVSGSIPAGMTLGTTLTGTPTESGEYNFTLQAIDDNGAVGSFLGNTRAYRFSVASHPPIGIPPMPNTALGWTPGLGEGNLIPPATPIGPQPDPSTFASDSLFAPAPLPTISFTRNLWTSITGDDVKVLQQFLNREGFVLTKNDEPGAPGKETSKFGKLTREALIRFQEAHYEEILAPLGLTRGTGFFGPLTKKYIETHYGGR